MESLFLSQIIVLKKTIQSFLNEEAKVFNLNASEMKLIHILSFYEGESQAELAKRMDCDKAHIHRIVIKLFIKKIIHISNKKEDNCRNVRIMLTEQGKQIAEKINKKHQEWKSILIRGISQEDITATKRVLDQIINNIKEIENV